MDIREQLTNEYLKKDKRFGDDQFKRIRYLITLAENMILSGRDPRVKVDSQNRAVQILAEVANGKDFLDEISYYDRDDTDRPSPVSGTFKTSASPSNIIEEDDELLTKR